MQGVRGRISNFDYLRLFLALEVVVLHCGIFAGAGPRWVVINAVPAFVCLSGFLIPDSFTRSDGWRHFAWKRLLRVGPAFLACLFVVAMLNGKEALEASLVFYVTMGLLYMPACTNGSLWSLMLEEWLYASHVACRLRRFWNAELVATLAILFMLGSAIPHLFFGQATMEGPDRILRAASAYFAGNWMFINRAKLLGIGGYKALIALVVVCCAVMYIPKDSAGMAPLILATSVLSVLSAYRLPQLRWSPPDF